jgi:hypothetical protein
VPWCITDAIDPFPTLAGSRSAIIKVRNDASLAFSKLRCDGAVEISVKFGPTQRNW